MYYNLCKHQPTTIRERRNESLLINNENILETTITSVRTAGWLRVVKKPLFFNNKKRVFLSGLLVMVWLIYFD